MTGQGAIRAAAILLALVLTACASSRQTAGPEMAHAAGWRWEILPAGAFDLATAAAPRQGTTTLVVYLEGDGFAYVHPRQPSSDPTPDPPVALRMALAHPGPAAVAWLGRPCQYTLPDHGRHCRVAFWTGGRYAPEVIDSMAAAIDVLKQRSGADHLILVGYSGGGAVAVLLAARRPDVAAIVTVAADLDLAYWTRRDELAPLSESLDPADEALQVATIPQVHFAGSRDSVVGADVARAFLHRLPAEAPARLLEIADFTHACCWAAEWGRLAEAPELTIIPGWTDGHR